METETQQNITEPSQHILDVTQGRSVLEIFQHAFSTSRCPHSWIISGKPGIGKSALARSIAHYVLSQSNGHNSLSGHHEGLINQITSGSHPDLILLKREINAKTGKLKQDIGVNDARKVASFFSRHASGDGWRICIIDKADDLNRAASNALLKIVEEPPEKSLILFISNAASRILPTLRSRCRIIKCAPLSADDITTLLQAHDPALPLPELDLISILAAGSIEKALHLKDGGLDIYREMLACLETLPKAEWTAINKFIQSLSGAANKERYAIFAEELVDFLHRITSHTATNTWPDALSREQQLAQNWRIPKKMAHFSKLTTQIEATLQQKEVYNLDPALTLTQIFQNLSAEAV